MSARQKDKFRDEHGRFRSISILSRVEQDEQIPRLPSGNIDRLGVLSKFRYAWMATLDWENKEDIARFRKIASVCVHALVHEWPLGRGGKR